MWREALAAVVRAGGTISHHHGVGRSRSGYMMEEHGDSLELIRMLKKTLDPSGVLNPGKLGLDGTAGESASVGRPDQQ
jgi:FAD/FMN-containing dehydrogenase